MYHSTTNPGVAQKKAAIIQAVQPSRSLVQRGRPLVCLAPEARCNLGILKLPLYSRGESKDVARYRWIFPSAQKSSPFETRSATF
jgi:hypothetical protein